jgi:hypothetical protein
MISLALDAARHVVRSGTTRIGVIVVLLAILLIAERELLRAIGGKAAASGVRAAGAVVFPVVVAVILVLGVRLGHFA